MNWSKNLYVFMLGALIVFSGCIGTGTTDGEGDADTAGTTVINNHLNYYNNTTEVIYYNNTTEVITEMPEMIALGGLVLGDGFGSWNTATINTTAGQMLMIEEVEINCTGWCSIRLDTFCATHLYPDVIFFSTAPNLGAVPGSAFDCMNGIVIINEDWPHVQDISWSLVYSIHPVTVG